MGGSLGRVDEPVVRLSGFGRNAIVPTVPAMKRRLAVVIFPGFQLLDAAGPIAAFEIAARFQPGAYEIHVLAPEAGLVASTSGVSFQAEALGGDDWDTVMVVGGDATRAVKESTAIIDWLRPGRRPAPRVTNRRLPAPFL